MVRMNISENFSYIYQNEGSIAHWKTSNVSLYTAMIWFLEHSVSMVLLSDNNIHDKTTHYVKYRNFT